MSSISNPGVDAAALIMGILPLARLAGITDVQIAAANKDGVVGTASMRTIGAGAQQAAAGNHTHTVGSTEIEAPFYFSIPNDTMDYVEYASCTVPAAAKRVVAHISNHGRGTLRVVYDGAEKGVLADNTPPYCAHFHFAGKGSAATLSFQGKTGIGFTGACKGGAVYITV